MTGSFLIFGASGGIGSAVCRRLKENGSKVAIAGRSEERLRVRAFAIMKLLLQPKEE